MDTCNAVLNFESVGEIHGVTIQMKSLWQHVRMVLFVFRDLKKKNDIWDFF